MYTKEQNEEIEKVCRVFDSYIRENPYFDVVWSDKLGYIYLSGIAPDREGVCMAPLILRTGEDLCEEIIYNMAADILKQIEYIVTIQKTVPQTNGKRLKKN